MHSSVFDVNSRTVLKIGAQADRLEQIRVNYNAFVPPVEVINHTEKT